MKHFKYTQVPAATPDAYATRTATGTHSHTHVQTQTLTHTQTNTRTRTMVGRMLMQGTTVLPPAALLTVPVPHFHTYIQTKHTHECKHINANTHVP